MYFTDRGIEELETRRGADEVSLAWLAEQLRTLNVSVLQQDVERFERSAKQLEAAHGQRAGEIIRLEAELEDIMTGPRSHKVFVGILPRD